MTALSDWLLGSGFAVKLLILIAFGLVSALGQAPWGLWPLTLVGLGGAMILISGAMSGRRVFVMGWTLGTGYFALCLHWIVEPFLVDVERYGWMAPFALILMALGGGLFWAMGAWVARAVGRGVVTPGRLALGLLLAEMARSFLFTGFPWTLIGHVWIGWQLDQLAAWIGAHGLTAVTLIVAALLARAMWMRLLGVAALLLAGSMVVDMRDVVPGTTPLVRIVQPNAPQHLKWQPGYAELYYERALALSAGDGAAAALVVWPETSFPRFLNREPQMLADVHAAGGGAVMVVGGLRSEPSSYYNTVAVLGEGGVIGDSYDKSHLVPFGEYIPFTALFARLGWFDLTEGWTYGAGDGLHLIDVPGVGAALPLICYEYIFGEEVNAAEGRPRLMIMATNDAWFGNYAGPAQHLAQARLRSIEQGVPAVRAANTGISAMIDTRGEVLAQLALNTEGFLDAPLPLARAAPVYTRLGDWPVILGMIAFAAGQLVTSGRKGVDPAEVAS